MKLPLTVPATKFVSDSTNEPVPVTDLPEEIQNELACLDVIRQKHRDAIFEFEQVEILLQAKQQQIQRMVEAHFMRKEPEAP